MSPKGTPEKVSDLSDNDQKSVAIAMENARIGPSVLRRRGINDRTPQRPWNPPTHIEIADVERGQKLRVKIETGEIEVAEAVPVDAEPADLKV